MAERPKLTASLDRIVEAMVAAGYPVEATNKAGHLPDAIPADGLTDSPKYAEESLARALVGGWWSKAALIQLVVEARRDAGRQYLASLENSDG